MQAVARQQQAQEVQLASSPRSASSSRAHCWACIAVQAGGCSSSWSCRTREQQLCSCCSNTGDRRATVHRRLSHCAGVQCGFLVMTAHHKVWAACLMLHLGLSSGLICRCVCTQGAITLSIWYARHHICWQLYRAWEGSGNVCLLPFVAFHTHWHPGGLAIVWALGCLGVVRTARRLSKIVCIA
jgi:hypothetical protein